jgi:hypothetical protein
LFPLKHSKSDPFLKLFDELLLKNSVAFLKTNFPTENLILEAFRRLFKMIISSLLLIVHLMEKKRSL